MWTKINLIKLRSIPGLWIIAWSRGTTWLKKIINYRKHQWICLVNNSFCFSQCPLRFLFVRVVSHLEKYLRKIIFHCRLRTSTTLNRFLSFWHLHTGTQEACVCLQQFVSPFLGSVVCLSPRFEVPQSHQASCPLLVSHRGLKKNPAHNDFWLLRWCRYSCSFRLVITGWRGSSSRRWSHGHSVRWPHVGRSVKNNTRDQSCLLCQAAFCSAVTNRKACQYVCVAAMSSDEGVGAFHPHLFLMRLLSGQVSVQVRRR